ncbi:MAG: anti-sigma factor family protein [Phototrophicaceae bacterium]
MAQTHSLPPETLEQLSAYLDGQLSQHEQHQVEQRLADDPVWQAEFASLQAMTQLLQELPPRRVPRDFTLTPKMVMIPRFIVFPATLPYSLSSAVAAVLLVTLGLRFILNGSSLNDLVPTSSVPYPEEVFRSARSLAILSTPTVAMTATASPVIALSAPMVADAVEDVASEQEGVLAQVAAPSGMVTLPAEESMARLGESAPMLQLEAGASPMPTLSPAPTATLTVVEDQPQANLAMMKRVSLGSDVWLGWVSVVGGIVFGIISFGTAWMRLQR